jgi:hypothetical protein
MAVAKKRDEVVGRPMDCELFHNLVLEAKVDKLKSLIRGQLAGMKYDQLLSLEILNEKYAVEMYSELADIALKEEDMPTLQACVNNLGNWGAKDMVEQLGKMLKNDEATQDQDGKYTDHETHLKIAEKYETAQDQTTQDQATQDQENE